MEDVFDILGSDIPDFEYKPANPSLHLLELEDGAEFNVGDTTFIKLGFEQGGILAITKQAVFSQAFNQNYDNNYRNSEIRTRLNSEFLPILKNYGAELLPYTIDLRAENGQTDYGVCTDMVGLLTADLFRKYYYQIPKLDHHEWLASPLSCLEDWKYAMYVNTSGYVGGNGANNAFRCRPACIFAI